MQTSRHWGLVSAALAFAVSFLFSEAIGTELRRYGVSVSEIIRKNLFNPLFGPRGVEMLPVHQSSYSADFESAHPKYLRSNVARLWQMYSVEPTSFVIGERQHDEDVHCWPKSATDKSVAIAFVSIRSRNDGAERLPKAFDAIVCTTIDADGFTWEDTDAYNFGLGCPRMGCPTSVYYRGDQKWRLVFDTPYCTAIYFVDTSRLGVKDLMCTGFEDQIYHWSGLRYD